jgi:carbamate kinase
VADHPRDTNPARPRRGRDLRGRRRHPDRVQRAGRAADRRLEGVEAVVDKDLASALLAIELGADALVIVTDVDAVYADWGTPERHAIRGATPDELAASQFVTGSMAPKVRATCWFAERSGGFAAIGSIHDTQALLRDRGKAGTRVALDAVRTG